MANKLLLLRKETPNDPFPLTLIKLSKLSSKNGVSLDVNPQSRPSLTHVLESETRAELESQEI